MPSQHQDLLISNGDLPAKLLYLGIDFPNPLDQLALPPHELPVLQFRLRKPAVERRIQLLLKLAPLVP